MAGPPDAPIRLTSRDARLLDASPILCLVRLDRALSSAAVAETFRRHRPRRLSAVVGDAPDGPVLLRQGPADDAFGTVDVGAGELARLTGVGVPLAALAAIGLGDAAARDPVATLTHVRAPDGDALAIRLSHAAGDGVSLLRMLGPLLDELLPARATGALGGTPASRRAAAERTAAVGPPPSAGRSRSDDDRFLSVLPLSSSCREELAAVAAARPALSPTVHRMAVVARRVSALVRPGADELRIRIPIDLRHRDLGVPPAAVGNHWLDALAVVGARSAPRDGGASDDEPASEDRPAVRGPGRALPPAEEIAAAVDGAIAERIAVLHRDDVDHRDDESLRLRRDLWGEPIRPGVDLVFSSLPAPARPGVRALHVLGLSSLGVVAVRGARHVDLVTARPLPAGVVEL